MYTNTHILYFGKLPDLLEKFVNGVFDTIDLKPYVTRKNSSTNIVDTDSVKELIKPGDKYLAVGKDTWQPISESIHLGPRGEGFTDCVIPSYLRTHNDTIFKFVYEGENDLGVEQTDWIRTGAEYERLKTANAGKKGHTFMNGFSKKTGKPYFMHKYFNLNPDIRDFLFNENYIKDYPKIKYSKIIRSSDDIKNSFNYFLKQEKTGDFIPRFGLDYETNGFPFDKEDYMTMGVGIADVKGVAAYYDMEWMNSVGGNFDVFLEYYKKFLDKFEEEIYVFNISFEQRVTYLLFNKLYFFSEAATINKVDAPMYPKAKKVIYKNMSLKWTAMNYLGVPSWDDDFDYLADKIDQMMKECTLENYKESEIWLEVMSKYQSEESEFDRLLNLYWGNAFACIPSNILGKYCNLDSYHTVLLRLVAYIKYHNPVKLEQTYRKLHKLKPEDPVTKEQIDSMDPWVMFNDNMRLGALLGIHGASIDLEEREHLSLISSNIIVVSKVNITKLYLFNELEHVAKDNLLDIPVFRSLYKYNNSIISDNNTIDFKDLVKKYVTDDGFSKDYYEQVPLEVRQVIGDLVNTMLDGNITPSIVRKRSFFTILNSTFESKWNIVIEHDYCSFDIDENHYEYNTSISDLSKNSKMRMQFEYLDYLSKIVDAEHPQTEFIDINGNTVDCDYLIKYCSDIVNIESPLDSPFTRLATLEQFYPVFVWLINRGIEQGDPIHVISKDIFNKRITYDDLKDIDLVKLAEKDINVKVFEMLKKISNQVIDKYLDQMKGDGEDPKYRLYAHKDDSDSDMYKYIEAVKKGKKAYKRFLIDHDAARFVRSCIQAELFDYDSKVEVEKDEEVSFMQMGDEDDEDESEEMEESTNDTVEEMIHLFAGMNGKISKAGKSATKYAKPPEVASWLDIIASMTNMKQDEYFELFNRRFVAKYFASTEDEMAFYPLFTEIDICSKTVGAFCKQCFCYSAAKKYAKILGTYIDGQFTKYNKITNQNNDDLISTERYHDEGDPNTVTKMYSRMNVCEKQSKRWSGSMHTVPSASETKRICNSPEGYLISYFDISGAEIRCISYLSNDQYMLDCYAKKLDPYMNLAAQLDPEHDEKYHRSIRWKYKMILLGSIYGMGIKMMAGMTGMTLEDCTAKHAAMFERMTGIGRIIKEKGGFCESHNGLCATVLGDQMRMSQLYPSRFARLGINQTIQGFAACSLAEGFFNVNYQSYKHPDIYPKVRVWNTVHDSSQNYFDLMRLFDIGDYYKMTLKEYLMNKYGINYDFDTEVGCNYFDLCDYNSISPTKLELTGSYRSLKSTLEKCKRGGLGFEIESIKNKSNGEMLELTDQGWWREDQFVPDVNPYVWGSYANIRSGNFCRAGFEKDWSKYSIIINKTE